MNSKLVVLSALLAAAVAMPRYALVPVEDLRYMAPHYRRVPRQVMVEPLPDSVPSSSDDRFVRQAGGGYGGGAQVDYGAYTGGHGAFGWYADYPVGGGYHR